MNPNSGWRLAARIAARELRGGIKGFGVLLACLALGVAAIAAVGMVRAAIERGLTDQGAVLLGGDAQVEFTYRTATPEERAWIDSISDQVSEVIDFRSMIVVGSGETETRALTQVKAVDAAYPLLGTLDLAKGTLPQALSGAGAVPGAVMDKILVDQLGLAIGDAFRLGTQEFTLGGVILREPDASNGGFALAPRVIVLTKDLANSGLIGPGTLFDSAYRMILPSDTDLQALQTQAETAYRDQGLRWSDRRNASPGVERFVDRIGSFLVLVGLAGLAVGGVGVASAVRAYLDGKINTIATLRSLGADGRLIFRIYLMQIAALSLIGVTIGLIIGAGIPIALSGTIEAALPFPAEIGFYPKPIVEAAFYGIVSAFLFALWPLARSEQVRAGALYRGETGSALPRGQHLMTMVILLVLLVGGAVVLSGVATLALSTAGGVAAALGVLAVAAWCLTRAAKRLARLRVLRGSVAWRLALASIGAPRSEAVQVVLALGLGLTVLASVGQIESNLRAAISRDLPTRAPSFFFVDIQNDQIDGFRAKLAQNSQVSKVESAPMLRGVVTLINGRDAREVANNHWVVMGDRGLTYSALKPEGTTLTAGEWWPEDYTGPPQVSFAAEEAEEIGLKLGDKITMNILGRDIEAEITSFRVVDFSNAGMGFVMSMNPAAIAGAPHTHIATVYANDAAEADILRDMSRAYPNITAIGIKAAIGRVSEALGAIAQATTLAAMATLLTGFVVLIGAAAAGERARRYEAAVLKVLGASRGQILLSFALRAALTGAAAGLVAILAGAIAGWAVLTFVMESPFQFEWFSALAIVFGGVMATLLAGLVFAWRPLAARPAQVLRSAE